MRTLRVSLVSLLAAGAVQAETTEVRFAHQLSGLEAAFMETLVAEFETANPDIDILPIVFSTSDYESTGLVTQLQSATPPDIYFQWAGFPVARDVGNGVAADLTDVMADGWKDTFNASIFSAGAGTTVDGRIYMVPWSLGVTVAIWYNQAIFEELGLSVPETWDELLAAVGTIKDAGITPIVIGNKDQWPLGNWFGQIAARIVAPEEYDAAFNKQAPFNSPGFLQAFELLQGLYEAGAFNIDMAGLDQEQAKATFFQSAAAMNPIGSWFIADAVELADADFRYSQFNTPVIPGTPVETNVSSNAVGFIVNANSSVQDEAISFLKFITSPENHIRYVTETSLLSPVVGANEAVEMPPALAGISALLSSATNLTTAPDTAYALPVARAFYQAAAFVATGEKSAQDALVWLDEAVAATGSE